MEVRPLSTLLLFHNSEKCSYLCKMKYEIGDMLYCIEDFKTLRQGRTYRITGFGTDIDYQTYYSLTSEYDGSYEYNVPETEVIKHFIDADEAYRIKERDRRIKKILN
jgi:hypothetical protein